MRCVKKWRRGVFFQKDENDYDHPLAFFSEKLNRAQRNYYVTELECYAVVVCVRKFRHYLEWYDFIEIAQTSWSRKSSVDYETTRFVQETSSLEFETSRLQNEDYAQER